MKIVIVDDHVLFREGLAAIIRSESDLKIIGQAGSVREAIETVKALKPDLVLMDFGLPDGTGADATRAILHQRRLLRDFTASGSGFDSPPFCTKMITISISTLNNG